MNKFAMDLILAQALAYSGFHPVSIFKNGVIKNDKPWHGINLTKEERKGKTFEEQQELRKQKYLQSQKKDS